MWVLGEARGTCWIRDHDFPFWGVVVGNAQLNVVVISGLALKWDRHRRRWWTDLRDSIGYRGKKISSHGIYWLIWE